MNPCEQSVEGKTGKTSPAVASSNGQRTLSNSRGGGGGSQTMTREVGRKLGMDRYGRYLAVKKRHLGIALAIGQIRDLGIPSFLHLWRSTKRGALRNIGLRESARDTRRRVLFELVKGRGRISWRMPLGNVAGGASCLVLIVRSTFKFGAHCREGYHKRFLSRTEG